MCAALTLSVSSKASDLEYDNKGQISSVVSNGSRVNYTYDALGNITREGDIEYSYDDHGLLTHVTTGDSVRRFDYDQFGRMTSNGLASMSYNQYNMMTSYDTENSCFQYGYHPLTGLRENKIMDDKRIDFTLDDSSRVIAARTSSEQLFKITWENNFPKTYVYEGKTYSYVCNRIGDVFGLIDSEGKLVNSYAYDVWGKVLSERESVPNPIRYRGSYYDSESGLYYLNGRYYDPSVRRFTTLDPAEDGVNWISYCGNDPVKYIDPSGYVRIVTYNRLFTTGVAINFSHDEAQRIFQTIDVGENLLGILRRIGVACPPAARTIIAGAWLASAPARAFDAINNNGFAINVMSVLGHPAVTVFLNTENM